MLELLRQRFQDVQEQALEDAVWMALRKAPEVAVDFGLELVGQVVDKRSTEGLDALVADRMLVVTTTLTAGIWTAALYQDDLFQPFSPSGDHSKLLLEHQLGVFWTDLAYSALRSDAELGHRPHARIRGRGLRPDAIRAPALRLRSA